MIMRGDWDAEGHISVKESIELIEEATTVKFGLC